MAWKPYFLAGLAAGLLLAGFSWPCAAQSQAPSVAEAARRAREQKKNAAKPVRTLTNDDLPKPTPAEAAAPAAPAEPPAANQAKPEEEAKPAAPEAAAVPSEAANQQEARKKAELRAALKQAKADLSVAENELGVLERKTALDSEAYYSQTDYVGDATGKARLDNDQRQVSDKKSDVAALKAKIAALEAATAEKP